MLLNLYIWLLSLCYVLRSTWCARPSTTGGNLYMSETLGWTLVTANSAVTMFELGGVYRRAGGGLGLG